MFINIGEKTSTNKVKNTSFIFQQTAKEAISSVKKIN